MSKEVLVLGGGFAGIESAIYLRKYGFSVTLISDRDFLYVYPTSIWIPTGEKKFEDVTIPLSKLAKKHGFTLKVQEVTTISAAEKTVTCGEEKLNFDYLIIAIGAHKVSHQGIENTLSICGAPSDAVALKERLDVLIAKGKGKLAFGFGGNPKDSSAVRGGPGFELLFNVHNLLKKRGIRDNFELTFFAPMTSPGARMGEKALSMMEIFFKRLKINKAFGKKIARFEPDGVVLEDESRILSDLTMFIPGGNGHAVIRNSDLPTNEAGFVSIDDNCRVAFEDASRNDIFAVGDVAAIDGPQWRAKQGHIAEVMARNAAYNIAQIEAGKVERKGYQEHLNILCVMDSGDGAAFVYRDDKNARMIPMPIIGHWLKKGWGWYYKNSKMNRIPRIPGM